MFNLLVRARQSAKALRRRRNLIARALLDPNGAYRPRTRGSRRPVPRHARHRHKALAEAIA